MAAEQLTAGDGQPGDQHAHGIARYQEKQTNLRTLYPEVCKSFHGIDDFRARLLGLLPLASGAGIFLLLETNIAESYLTPVALFGFLVTLGLFVYELRGLQRCQELIKLGAQMENELELEGQFQLHPSPLGGLVGAGTASFVP